MSHRHFGKHNVNQYVDDSLSKPTKQCRQAFHKDCPHPKRCPCYCHGQKEMKK